jgi:hypothetical protein
MTTLQFWLLAIGGFISSIVAAVFVGVAQGRAREEKRQLEARLRGASERVRADTDALRVGDPVGELRARGWVRGVEADRGGHAR